jgi:uncharacterized protein YndB with AHSA1/START domain
MKILLYSLLAVFVLALGLLAVGFSLKPEWRVERSIAIEAPPEPVFAYVSILRNWPEWTAWNSKDHPSIKYNFTGPEWGIGATQQWDDGGSNGQLEVTEYVPGEYMEYELIMDKGAYNIRGSLRIESAGKGSRLTWACWGDAGQRPVSKLIALAYRPLIGKAFSAGLENLQLRFRIDRTAPPGQQGAHGDQVMEEHSAAPQDGEPLGQQEQNQQSQNQGPQAGAGAQKPGDEHGGQYSED